jgi:hypothetical protein
MFYTAILYLCLLVYQLTRIILRLSFEPTIFGLSPGFVPITFFRWSLRLLALSWGFCKPVLQFSRVGLDLSILSYSFSCFLRNFLSFLALELFLLLRLVFYLLRFDRLISDRPNQPTLFLQTWVILPLSELCCCYLHFP